MISNKQSIKPVAWLVKGSQGHYVEFDNEHGGIPLYTQEQASTIIRRAERLDAMLTEAVQALKAVEQRIEELEAKQAKQETQPVQVTDGMAIDFCRALSDSDIGEDDMEEIKIGLRAALCNVTAPPAPTPASEPIFFIEVEGDDWINAGRIPGSTFDFNNLPDGVNKLYAAPPAPAVPRVIEIPETATLPNINQLCPLDKDLSQTDFATGWNDCRQYALTYGGLPPVIKRVHAAAQGWNACRAAMLAAAPGTKE
ncbi:hypothetical protein [Serratia marcescens]|uniref:hypothetical protein n=1 Tax=Serratia marcescens TaxID=615 RepID=UPI003D77A325